MKTKKTKDDVYTLSTIDNGLNVLNLFLENEELSATNVTKRLGINRSTAFRLLYTLTKKGYLMKSSNAKYRLGVHVFTLGQLAYSRLDIVYQVHPHLEVITEELNESSHLVIPDSAGNVIFIDGAEGKHLLTLTTPPGHREKAHQTSAGKAILAFQTEEALSAYIERTNFSKKTQHSIGIEKELRENLLEIKQQGYAMDNEEAELGLTCIAVPLLDTMGHGFAAISVSGPTSRMLGKKSECVEQLLKTANALKIGIDK